MSEVKALVYQSEWGDYYFPVEHYTLEDALEEMGDSMDWDEPEAREHYDGVQAIALHTHDIEAYEECPNYDSEVGDEPEPCLGYVNCHVF